MNSSSARRTRATATVTVTPAGPTCGGTGGGGTPPVPDCGTRRTQVDVRLEWRPSGPTGITLDNGTIVSPYPLLLNCPVHGDAFPHVLDAVGGAPIVPRIPPWDLFDPPLRKHIVLGHGRVRRPSSDGYIDHLDPLDRVTDRGPRSIS